MHDASVHNDANLARASQKVLLPVLSTATKRTIVLSQLIQLRVVVAGRTAIVPSMAGSCEGCRQLSTAYWPVSSKLQTNTTANRPS